MPNKDALWVDDTGKTVIVEVDENGDRVVPAPEPFGGKGDHDSNGKTGGAHPPVPEPVAPDGVPDSGGAPNNSTPKGRKKR